MDSDPHQWSVSQLLARCARQPVDEAAWAEFVLRYHPTIRSSVIRTFYRLASLEPDRKPQFTEVQIDDLTQTVYIRLIEDEMRAIRQFEGEHEDSIYQYLVMISVNVVRDLFRETKALKRPKVTYSLDGLLEDGEGALLQEAISGLDGKPMSKDAPSFTVEEIEKALNRSVRGKNSSRDTLIFKLRYYQGMKLDEIAKVMGPDVTRAGIGAILNRITKKLKDILEPKMRRR